MSNFYDHVGPLGMSGSTVLLLTIGVVAVLAMIHLRFFRKW